MEQHEDLIKALRWIASNNEDVFNAEIASSAADALAKLQAERDGRLVVLPCKVGDTVYVINKGNKLQEMIFDTVDLRCTCQHEGDCMCGSLCVDTEHSICQHRFSNDFSEFGKTIFFTREEAEKALEG